MSCRNQRQSATVPISLSILPALINPPLENRDEREQQWAPHHPGIQTNISMRLVLISLRRIDLDHIKLVILSIPVEDPPHARPSTPLHAPPAWLRAAHTDLGNPRDIYVRSIDARVPPPRAPSLLRLCRGGGTISSTSRSTVCVVRRSAHPNQHAVIPTPSPVPVATPTPPPVVATRERSMLPLPGMLAPTPARRRRSLLPVQRRSRRVQFCFCRRPVEGGLGAPRV
jgi:hypothetical protein